MRWKFVIAVTLLALSFTEAFGEVRTWIDKNGQRISAEYIGFKDGVVVLMQGVRRYRVPLSTLSDADQDYVRQKITEEAKKSTNPSDESSRPAGEKSKPSADAEMLALLDSIPKPSSPLTMRAETRVWTDHQGRNVSAKFLRVNEEGAVVLQMTATKTQTVPLETFVRTDIEYIRALLEADAEVKRAKAERQAIIDQISIPTPTLFKATTWRDWTDKNGSQLVASFSRISQQQSIYLELETGLIRSFPLEDFSPADLQYIRDMLKVQPEEQAVIDSIPKPTPRLFEQPETRVWTDRGGNQRSARFTGVQESGSVTLRYETHSSTAVPIEALSRKDLEYVRDYVENDAPAVIFPLGEFQPLTSTQEADGERIWTDRRGVKLNGKLKDWKGDLVHFESGGKTLTFPYAGLSANDQKAVSEEIIRRSNERRASASVASNSSPSYPSRGYGSSNYPGYGRNLNSGSGSSSNSNYGSSSNSNYGSSSNSNYGSSGYSDYSSSDYSGYGGGLVYEFSCSRCGATWTDSSPISSHSCASSSSSRSSGLSGSSRSRAANRSSGSSMSAYGAGQVVGTVFLVVLTLGGVVFLVSRFLY